jgi:hypothetical protein
MQPAMPIAPRPPFSRTARRAAARWVVLGAALAVAACASTPAREAARPAAQPPSTQVYFYPAQGQGAAQQDRDRYDCYRWATKQTGFDPSAPQLAPHQRLEIAPMPPPGHDTAVGAATGAVLGAVVAPRGKTAEGAAVGAVAGALIGAASDTARTEQAERLQEHEDQRAAERARRLEQQASRYRRAMAACLEGRGYTVR